MFSTADKIIVVLAFALDAIAIITAVVAFVGSRRGHYNSALIVCSLVPVCYSILTSVGTVYDFFNDPDGFWVDILIYVPLALIVSFAGSASLFRLRQNKQSAHPQSIP